MTNEVELVPYLKQLACKHIDELTTFLLYPQIVRPYALTGADPNFLKRRGTKPGLLRKGVLGFYLTFFVNLHIKITHFPIKRRDANTCIPPVSATAVRHNNTLLAQINSCKTARPFNEIKCMRIFMLEFDIGCL